MATQFVVQDSAGNRVDHIDPYLSHTKIAPDTYRVDNGYGKYDTVIPTGGSWVILPMPESDQE